MTTRDALIVRLKSVILGQEYTERDAFHLVGSYALNEPQIAAALAFHIRDITQEMFDTVEARAQLAAVSEGAEDGDALEFSVELDYSVILADAYERTFFNQEHAAKYGTEVFAGDEEKLAMLVGYVETLGIVVDSKADNVTPMHNYSTRAH